MDRPGRRTKIVATIGPASEGDTELRALLNAGVDVVRLNLAHGSPDEHVATIGRVRALAAERARPVGVLCDLPGPKIRTAAFPDGGVFLVEGNQVELVAATDGGTSTDACIGVDYPDVCADMAAGDQVTLGDGAIVLRVERCMPDRLLTRVVSGGRLQGRPGVHLPADRLRVSTPTAEDLQLLEVAVGAGADFIAISFVRTADDVGQVRSALAGVVAEGAHPVLVAKIETRTAVDNLDAIMDAADALMVARGDLGTDYPIEEVPHLQKRIVRACVEWGRPVITATQMLESMVNSPMPTRAEASDVANAVFDGTDAVMLSAETAIGRDPPHVVRTMARLVTRAEREASYVQWGSRLGRMQRRSPLDETLAITAATTHAAWTAAVELAAKAIVCCTRSGLTARAMARFRPPCLLLGCSYDERTVRQLTLSWGVLPLRVDFYESTDEMVWFSVETLVRNGLAEHGDVAVVLAGAPEDEAPSTDVLRVVRIR
ncbi:MAG: pyruvate kinase [Acidimicrobiales bacterium]